jgi:hypothetical protein
MSMVMMMMIRQLAAARDDDDDDEVETINPTVLVLPRESANSSCCEQSREDEPAFGTLQCTVEVQLGLEFRGDLLDRDSSLSLA